MKRSYYANQYFGDEKLAPFFYFVIKFHHFSPMSDENIIKTSVKSSWHKDVFFFIINEENHMLWEREMECKSEVYVYQMNQD